MSKSVSTDALWEKLSEIEEKINKSLQEQKTSVSAKEQVDISPELKANKDEIVEVFKKCIQGLGTHCDSHFKKIHQDIEAQDEIIGKVWNIVSRIRKQQRESTEVPKESIEPLKEDGTAYFNFRFFKVRKTSLVITILGLLVFILTLFGMKQQNDHSLLLNEYHRQDITIWKLQTQVDSLRNAVKPTIKKKR
jgi:hypothetical protein